MMTLRTVIFVRVLNVYCKDLIICYNTFIYAVLGDNTSCLVSGNLTTDATVGYCSCHLALFCIILFFKKRSTINEA